jgi:RNA polymerase sigma factor (TIGR02999 family)
MYSAGEITRLLAESRKDEAAAERLFEVVYAELRGIAGNQLRMERPDHTLQATALANEVYLKLVGQNQVDWENRGHFFAIAARAARRLLVDHARARLRAKRGGGAPHTGLTRAGAVRDPHFDTELVALDAALSRLKLTDPVKYQVVEMRHFGGFSNEEIGKALGVSTRTVDRHWRYARAWLYRALRDGGPEDASVD